MTARDGHVRDNLALEASAAASIGDGEKTLGRVHGRDVVFSRFKYYG